MKEVPKKKHKIWQKILFWIIGTTAVLVGGFLLLMGVLFITEYRPGDRETLGVDRIIHQSVPLDTPISVMTFNIGYGALGDNADFFMDGGKSVQTADPDRLSENMNGIEEISDDLEADFVLFQEVDEDSTRSHHLNEKEELKLTLWDYQSVFAYNYRVVFIPYPVPPIGKVDAGILTLSHYEFSDAVRIQLPCPFTGIERLGNLKRCLLVSYHPVEGTDRQLALVNLHLEAYDDGAGKAAQTEMLRQVLQEEYEKGNYVIAGGDFNQTFSGVDTSAYPVYPDKWQPGIINEGDFPEDWQFVMDPSVPSCRSLDRPYAGADPDTFQYYMIDGFILSPNVKLLEAKTQDLGFVSADHNPVLIKVSLEP